VRAEKTLKRRRRYAHRTRGGDIPRSALAHVILRGSFALFLEIGEIEFFRRIDTADRIEPREAIPRVEVVQIYPIAASLFARCIKRIGNGGIIPHTCGSIT
jgi:hypothetical protein